MTQKSVITAEAEFGGGKIVLETGRLAPQATAVKAQMGGTTVLAAVTSTPAAEDPQYFPLKVDYEEKYYAGGRISGSRFMRREGRPTDEAIVEARLIDHAIRPLFPNDFMDEVQLVITVLSIDNKINPLLLGFLAASAALSASDLPFSGPIIPLRTQKIDGVFTYTLDEVHVDSVMNVIVSYLDEGKKVQAMEAYAKIVPEEDIINSVKEGGKSVKPLFDLINDFVKKAGVEKREYTPAWLNEDVIKEFHPLVMPKLDEMEKKNVKFEGDEWNKTLVKMAGDLKEKYEDKYSLSQIKEFVSEVQKDFVRKMVVENEKRVDGRKPDEIRELTAEVGVLPRVHGSALFERGMTQSLNIATLGSGEDTLLRQDMHGEQEKRYFHHYNFPPFSTGETGRMGGPGRREIGHGILAERALLPVLPLPEDFPYTVRVVSEIMSSNGSTSMAATCGSSLSLMDAGVPLKSAIAGIGVGLFVDKSIKDPKVSDFRILTDIIGYEDYAGYMDFKMTGNRDGITAIQMELKLNGIPVELLDSIFAASHSARMKVLDVMDKAISAPRDTVSEYAPKFEVVRIEKDQIGQVIGSGGAMIKGISADYRVEVDIDEFDDYANVVISAVDKEDLQKAKEFVKALTTPAEMGKTYEGIVTRIEDYGAFVEIAPQQEGLLHVSEISYEYVDNVRDHFKLGQSVQVKVIGLENGKISVSSKALKERPEGVSEQSRDNDRNGGFQSRGHQGRRDNRSRR